MASISSGSLSFSQCQKITDKSLKIVLNFAENIDSLKPSVGFLGPILKLDELRIRVNKANRRFLTEKEISEYITPMVHKIISWRPKITDQLRNFWNAHNEIGLAALATGSSYQPLEMANTILKKIIDANKVYLSVVDALRENSRNKNYIYALFYAQILATETAEYTFREQLEKLLKDHGLNKKFDSAEIFSVDQKISRGKKYITDSRAIRNSLGHYQFELEDVRESWEIKFNNLDDGYNFTPIFSEKDFFSYMENADLLYKSQAFLIWLYVASATVSAAFQV